MQMKIKQFVAVGVLIFMSLLLYANESNLVKIARVIDGDTFETDSGEKVRIIGVDTPETKDPRKPVQYFGVEASEYSKKCLEGKTVRLEYDQEKTDKYGRTLAYVFIPSDSGDIFYNEQIIKDGYAFAYVKYPFNDVYMQRFRNAESVARERASGLWADTTQITKEATKSSGAKVQCSAITKKGTRCKRTTTSASGMCGQHEAMYSKKTDATTEETPAETLAPAKSSKSENVTVYATKSGACYHSSGCSSLRKSSIPMSLKDAKARGLRPCSKCSPPS